MPADVYGKLIQIKNDLRSKASHEKSNAAAYLREADKLTHQANECFAKAAAVEDALDRLNEIEVPE